MAVSVARPVEFLGVNFLRPVVYRCPGGSGRWLATVVRAGRGLRVAFYQATIPHARLCDKRLPLQVDTNAGSSWKPLWSASGWHVRESFVLGNMTIKGLGTTCLAKMQPPVPTRFCSLMSNEFDLNFSARVIDPVFLCLLPALRWG